MKTDLSDRQELFKEIDKSWKWPDRGGLQNM